MNSSILTIIVAFLHLSQAAPVAAPGIIADLLGDLAGSSDTTTATTATTTAATATSTTAATTTTSGVDLLAALEGASTTTTSTSADLLASAVAAVDSVTTSEVVAASGTELPTVSGWAEALALIDATGTLSEDYISSLSTESSSSDSTSTSSASTIFKFLVSLLATIAESLGASDTVVEVLDDLAGSTASSSASA